VQARIVGRVMKVTPLLAPLGEGQSSALFSDKIPHETYAEIAKEMGIARDRVELEWRAAKAWLRLQLYERTGEIDSY
jgi:hypothetical protein